MSDSRGLGRVSDVMTQNYALVQGTTTVAEALRLMRDRNLTSLIVDKRTEDDEYGIVLLSDIAKKVMADNAALPDAQEGMSAFLEKRAPEWKR